MLILIKKKNNNVDINKNMKTHPLQGPDQGPDQGSQTRCLYSFNNGKTKKKAHLPDPDQGFQTRCSTCSSSFPGWGLVESLV
jgi:hypothetical protein